MLPPPFQRLSRLAPPHPLLAYLLLPSSAIQPSIPLRSNNLLSGGSHRNTSWLTLREPNVPNAFVWSMHELRRSTLRISFLVYVVVTPLVMARSSSQPVAVRMDYPHTSLDVNSMGYSPFTVYRTTWIC